MTVWIFVEALGGGVGDTVAKVGDDAFEVFLHTLGHGDYGCRHRQHVLGLGYRSGKSFQLASERKTHKMPSKHSRSDLHGRPPLSVRGRR